MERKEGQPHVWVAPTTAQPILKCAGPGPAASVIACAVSAGSWCPPS